MFRPRTALSVPARDRVPLPSLHALLFLGLALLAPAASRQQTASTQFRATQWTADSGLPQNIVRGIVQTPDGYLWLATLNGLARFDGVRFTVFDKGNSPGLISNRIAAIASGSGSDLWLLSEDGNITRYHDSQFHPLGESEGIPTRSVVGITSDSLGHVWILGHDTILQWNEITSRFAPTPNPADLHYQALSWLGTGFWSIRDRRLYCFVRGKLTTYPLPSNLDPTDVRKVAVGYDGAVWIDLPHGRFGRLEGDHFNASSTPIETLSRNPLRSSWKIQIGEHLDRTLTFPSGDLGKRIHYNAIFEDSENNMWIASEGQGLFRVQPQTIRVYSSAQGLAGDNVYPVFKARNGDMWIGSWPGGLTRFHDGQLKNYTAADGIPGLVNALAEDDNGNLWIGTHSGLVELSQGHVRVPSNMPRTMPSIQCIFPFNGSLLLGTPDGVFAYNGRSVTPWTLPNGSTIGDVRIILQTSDGDLWLGGYSGLTNIHNQHVTHWTEHEGLPSDNVRVIHRDSDGIIWIGTYDGGLARHANGKWTVYNRNNGLFDNGVFQILEDSRDNFWISSNRGIYRVSKQQLNDFAAGKQDKIFSVSYGKSDGMLNIECNGGLWPSGAIDSRGKLWFPTQQGVAVVDPQSVPSNSRPPRVAIESVSLEHNPLALNTPITIRPRQQSLEIQYTAFSFARPEQLTFRYMLEGIESKWEEAGYRRTAYFSHLPPGDYVFHVMAATNDGIWSTNDASIRISVLPPFYRTNWFAACIGAIALLGMWRIWNFRVNRLKRAQVAQKAFSQQLIASQESERRRISAELHDSLGQRLIIIKNLALLLLRPSSCPQIDEDREKLEEISSEASNAIDETRAISYDLRPFQLDRLGLTKAIEALARSASRASDITFSAQIADIDDAFQEDLRINFYRIVQEAINNILKHSKATEAQINVERTNRHVSLSIRDNGKGLLSQPRAVIAGSGGFGLTGMRERAALLNGTVKVHTDSGSGTTLSAHFLTTT